MDANHLLTRGGRLDSDYAARVPASVRVPPDLDELVDLRGGDAVPDSIVFAAIGALKDRQEMGWVRVRVGVGVGVRVRVRVRERLGLGLGLGLDLLLLNVRTEIRAQRQEIFTEIKLAIRRQK